MAYTPTTWVNDVTAINATRMNNIETGVDNTDQALTDHLADTTDAHDASAISIVDSGTYFTATHVEGALQEIGAAIAPFSYVCLVDQKTQNTAGGTFTSGAWQTRTLNTERADADGICTLSSNQITLAAGTYRCLIKCNAEFVDHHQARLQNVTDASTVLVGTTEYTQASGTSSEATSSMIMGEFTIAASKALEVQHRCGTTNATNGWGSPANFTTEVYAVAEFWRVG